MESINIKIESNQIIGGLRDCIKLFLEETKEEVLSLKTLEKYNFTEKDLYDMILTKQKLREYNLSKILESI